MKPDEQIMLNDLSDGHEADELEEALASDALSASSVGSLLGQVAGYLAGKQDFLQGDRRTVLAAVQRSIKRDEIYTARFGFRRQSRACGPQLSAGVIHKPPGVDG
jgi:hypothetical protein